eukprot:CAMPEP_0119109814 /NCGR_PEP_ID=MMETSP1180-20130426/23708_1 /TAXON_ID=3052 ORGANISM="Chlamydomonas cf sp, Strain CCMP681" /NCGR_SAMPLE_ID=MMETSP1180 /ASSEMBLY_ACC=CAM_ASM_000741 /LENGTH=82 /DNA_ID=CAMNT_0007095791 /DNA_START=16 /DNA_END=264 /DNA_ORIENTATION=+
MYASGLLGATSSLPGWMKRSGMNSSARGQMAGSRWVVYAVHQTKVSLGIVMFNSGRTTCSVVNRVGKPGGCNLRPSSITAQQ